MVLVAKYSLNGHAGDSAGTRNGGAVNITRVYGKQNQGASFNGTSSEINGIANFGITSTMTASIWCFIGTASTAGGAFFGIESQSPNNGAPSFGITQSSGTKLYVNKSFVALLGLSSALSLVNNTWNHFAFTYSGSQLIFYHNGVQINTVNVSNTFNTANTMVIGRDGTPGGTSYLNRSIDELEIYNHVLSPGEIKMKYLYYLGYL